MPKKTIKFLHIADIHIGKALYKSEERSDDFFYALKDVIEKHAIGKVDFVIIAGDFFDVRKVSSRSMNQAVVCLNLLKESGIPVIAIEGNHDSHEFSSDTSWLRSLSKWGFLCLLEPVYHPEKIEFVEWNSETRTGSFIDIKDSVRIYGNNWCGSITSDVILKINDSLSQSYDPSKFNIMLLHADIEGQLSHPIKGVSVERLTTLKTYIDYLALGHIHKNFEIAEFAYNPGGLENATVDEVNNKKGAYLVTISGKKHKAELIQEYRKRPIHRLKLEVKKENTPEEIEQIIFSALNKDIKPFDDSNASLAPILEIKLEGVLGFKTSLLNLNSIKDKIKKDFKPLLSVIKNQTIPVDIVSEVSENVSWKEREKKVINDIITKDPRYSLKAESIADLVLEIKRMALSGEDPENIVNTIDFNN